jgi:hypothetical protein
MKKDKTIFGIRFNLNFFRLLNQCSYYLLSILLLVSCRQMEELKLDNASVHYSDEQIIVMTGLVKRVFEVTSKGLITTEYTDLNSGENFILPEQELQADWEFPSVKGNAKLQNIRAEISDDEGFTSKHIEVAVHFSYPDDNLDLKYTLWVYPDAPGIRTQLFMKKLQVDTLQNDTLENIVEQLNVYEKYAKVFLWGYADGTQFLNNDLTPIMKSESLQKSDLVNDWASGLSLSDSNHGLVMIKESNKCFNSRIVANNGHFIINGDIIANTGSGYSLSELNEKEYKLAWASWTVLYNGNDDDMQLKIKQFDRLRYPVDYDRDMYIIANTWGSAPTKKGAKLAAREENVLKEIDSQADLGIDVQQIDDGWQGCSTGSDTWKPVQSISLNEEGNCDVNNTNSVPMYPSGGWGKVKNYAREKSVRLGLWVHGRVTYDDLVWNYKNGDFMAIKYDFFSMKTKTDAENHFKKVRDFIRFTDHQVRVNWDVTGPGRVGYYFGRDLGVIYLANRKADWPAVTTYRPHLVLRDAWHLANYVNLNKFQITVTNIDLVNKHLSDASKYSHAYSFAISMMAVPVFFQETQLYSDKAREELRPLIAIYKKHRQNIFDSFIFPIGDQPDNASWSGFQAYNPTSEAGYLTVFRELNNPQKEFTFNLRFIKNQQIKLTNLLTEETNQLKVGKNGDITIHIENPADFRFLKYECL